MSSGQSKSAMILYARALAKEYAEKGLRIQAINVSNRRLYPLVMAGQP